MDNREKRDFEKVIDDFQKQDVEYKALGKDIENKKSFIKAKLKELDLDIYETQNCTAKITFQNRVSMDEEAVIEIIKENIPADKRNSVIKTKEYVDYDVLESLIYNGVIAAEKLEKAQTIKVVASLTVKPIKKKEKADE